MSYEVLTALHIIFVVTWFSGLFYIVRLFVYHQESYEEDEFSQRVLQQQYKVMEKRLWYGIAWPSMVLALFFGLWMLMKNPNLFTRGFMHLKLGMVLLLILYHIVNHFLFLRFQKDQNVHSGFKLRIWNEVATVFLVSIVFIVVLRDSIDWIWGTLGILIFALALYLAILLYRRIRDKKGGRGSSDLTGQDRGTGTTDVTER